MNPDPQNNLFKKALSLLDTATKKVPLLKYVWALIAALCLLWLIRLFQIKVEDVCWFTIAVLLLCFLAYTLSLFLDKKDPVIKVARYMLVYIVVLNFAYFLTGVNPVVYARLLSRVFKVQKDSVKIMTKPPGTRDSIKKPKPGNNQDPGPKKRASPNLETLIIRGKTMENSIDNKHHRVIPGDTVENWEDQCLKYLTPEEKVAFNHYCDSVALQKPCIQKMLSYLREK